VELRRGPALRILRHSRLEADDLHAGGPDEHFAFQVTVGRGWKKERGGGRVHARWKNKKQPKQLSIRKTEKQQCFIFNHSDEYFQCGIWSSLSMRYRFLK
jgi:hypothetical protein